MKLATIFSHEILIEFPSKTFCFIKIDFSPSKSTALHFIRQRNIVTPHVELPFSQTENTAKDIPTVDADSHIDVASSGFPHDPEMIKK